MVEVPSVNSEDSEQVADTRSHLKDRRVEAIGGVKNWLAGRVEATPPND